MTPRAEQLVVGEEWVYRLRDDAPSERVRIRAVAPKPRSFRVEVEFLDDAHRRVEAVPGSRLRVPWIDRASFDTLMANWERLDQLALDDVERTCVEEAFDLLIGAEVAELVWSPVTGVTRLQHPGRLSAIIGLPLEEVLGSCAWFDHDGAVLLSPVGTLLIAESACHTNPNPVLDAVLEQETIARHKCKHGGHGVSVYTGKDEPTSPAEEFDWYRRYDRPRHELLRQWCGHRAITFHERLLAAEAESQRLDVLVTDLITVLRNIGETEQATRFAEQHERDRITVHKIRPIVDRPLDPSEIPVRVIRVRQHRWW